MSSSSVLRIPSRINAFTVADVFTEPATDVVEPPRAKRSAGKWLLLLTVWSIGIVVWTLYIALLIAIGAYLS